MRIQEFDTPALVVDSGTLRHNLEWMQKVADRFGVRLRPHVKTHKSPHIARRQMEAGACGITAAKVSEAEAMADGGLEDILIANQIVGAAKIERSLELARRVRLAVLVDSATGVDMLQRACAEADQPLDVLIEVDTGKGRCGLADEEEIVALADRVAAASHLRLRGVETHEGHVPVGVENAGGLQRRAVAAGERIVAVAATLRERGHFIDEVSVGSTPAAPYTASVEGITEMRPGTYVFNDVNQMALGQAHPEDCALSVLATVISRPAPDRAVLDAGSKSLFAEAARQGFALAGYDGFGYIREAHTSRIASLSEEHAVVELPEGVEFPDIGGKVTIIPNHVCPAVNLHDHLHIVDGDDVIDSWPIAARGAIR